MFCSSLSSLIYVTKNPVLRGVPVHITHKTVSSQIDPHILSTIVQNK